MVEKLKDNYTKLIEYVCVTLCTMVLSMVGFWMTMGQSYINRVEAREIASKEVAILTSRVAVFEENEKEFKRVLEKNTEVLTSLKIQLGLLEQTLHNIKDMK